MEFPLHHGYGTHASSCLQPSQIVRLEQGTSCLYAEVVQVIESRQNCWVHPLLLIVQPVEQTHSHTLSTEPESTEPEWYDLRQDSDLLLPLMLFQVALDVEVLPWLAMLYPDDWHRGNSAIAIDSRVAGHQQFRAFIQQVWQAHPEVFQAASHLRKT